MKLRIPTKSNSPLVEGSSGSHESARAQEAAATLAELTASNHLSQEEIGEEIESEMFVSKLDAQGITKLATMTERLVTQAFAQRSTKVQKMYSNNQEKWFKFMRDNNVTDFMDDGAMIAFFEEKSNEYRPNTLWVMYSCINRWYILHKKFNLNGWPRLRLVLKNLTERYVATKAATFSASQIHKAIRIYEDSEDHRDFLKGIVIMLSYYGLMRGADVMKIQKKDVNFNKRENCWEVTFNYVRKRVNPGFSYLIPMMYNDYMDKYYSQVIDIPEDKWKNPLNPPRFVRNWNVKGKKRIQNAGIGNISKFAGETAEMLGLDPKQYSNHSWRRSAATNLADSGVTLTNLKRHGQWASDTVCEGYIAQSRPLKLERLTCLMPNLSIDDDDRKPPHVKDEIMLEDVSEKRKRHSRHTGMTQSDKVGSNEEAYLVNEDGEPVVKKRKKSPAKNSLPFKNALGGPVYSNCTVHMYYNDDKNDDVKLAKV